MKNNYYQKIRGICALIVLLIHVLYITDNIYINYTNVIIRRTINFAVPVFVFLSGYFTKIDNIKSFYSKKITRIVTPLLIWKIIYVIIDPIYPNIKFINIVKNLILGGYHLYYLIVLICLFILTPMLIKYIKNNTKIKLLLPLITTIIYNIIITIYYIKNNNAFLLYNYYIFGWFSYYYLGLLLNIKKPKLDINSNKYVIIGLIISILEGLITYKTYRYYDLSISQLTFSNTIYSLAICLVIYCQEKTINNKNLLTKIGNYSYGIYLSHILFLLIIKKLYTFNNNYFINIILIYILLVLTTYLFNYIYYEIIKNKKRRKEK